MGSAVTKVSSEMFAPIALPKDKMEFLPSAEVTATTISGSDVATATTKILAE